MADHRQASLAGSAIQGKASITHEEHQLIVGREKNPERRNFYELCWYLGGSKTDVAKLKAGDVA